jgi:hypothetical protein
MRFLRTAAGCRRADRIRNEANRQDLNVFDILEKNK